MASGPSGRGSTPRRRISGGGSRGAGRRTPGAALPPKARSRPSAGKGARRPSGVAASAREVAPRPRFTGRAAVLVLVVALLMVSYASSMRAYLEQRRHLADLRDSISTSQAKVDQLTREKKRWHDPAYVRTMAHQRFGWVMPGEIGFQVLDANGKPMDHTDTLSPPNSVTDATRPLWWQAAWGSVVAAGKPPVDKHELPPPVAEIDAPKAPKGSR
jgi:cell division protein FtsB